ncbi:acyltransferase family protein, partial [Acinetobacter pittii]
MINKNLAAEGLRGIACIIVVLSHLSLTFFPQLHNYFSQENFPSSDFLASMHNSPFLFFISGTGAVYIFFILSGYVLTAANLNAKNPKIKLKTSIIKRYPRLAIPALCSCIISYLIFHISIDLSKTTNWFSQLIPQNISFLNSIYSSLITPFIFAESKYNTVLWTMKNELIGSLIIFYLIYLKNIQKIKHFYFFSFLFLIISLSISKIFLLGILSFILGMAIYHMQNINKYLSLFLLILGLYFIGFHKTSASYQIIYEASNHSKKSYDYTIFTGSLFITYAILKSHYLSQILSQKVLINLGKLSFSIYLNHLVILYIIGIPVFNFFIKNLGESFFFSAIISSLITIFTSIVFSILFYKLVDKY